MKISVIGATGKMGRAVITETINTSSLSLSGGFVRNNSNFIGFDLGEIVGKYKVNIKASNDLSEIIQNADAIIDFSAPQISLEAVRIASKYKKTFISGTTGFSEKEFKELQSYAKNIPIIWASNMSIGINLLTLLTEQACHMLGSNFDTEIVEMHHKHKKDAPSGTALSLGKAIAKAKGIDFAQNAILSREGSDCKRNENEIGFATLRGGSVIGDHTVMFAGENERIELSHKAVNRSIFADGALRAAKWAKNKPVGFYSMQDVLRNQVN